MEGGAVKPWWVITWPEAVFAVLWMLGTMAVLGTPTYTVTWVAIPFAFMLGKWVFWKWRQ